MRELIPVVDGLGVITSRISKRTINGAPLSTRMISGSPWRRNSDRSAALMNEILAHCAHSGR